MTKEMFEWITKWQRETFTQATYVSALAHLFEEMKELDDDLILSAPKEKIISEYADCFLLLFGSACLYGLSYEDICQAINDKMEINKQRQWGKPNDKGYVKHVKFKPGEQVYLTADVHKELYIVDRYTGETSKGPDRQFEKSPTISVKDLKGRYWQFREDALSPL